MKAKVAIAIVVVLLVAAQFFFGGKKKPVRPASGGPPATAESVVTPTPPAPVELARPNAADVTEVAVGTGDGFVHLERTTGGWNVVGHKSAAADSSRVNRFLTALLESGTHPLPSGDAAVTGLDDDGGLPIRLTTAAGDYELRIGLCPEGEYGASYARLPGGQSVVLEADVRGLLGLWKNDPAVIPDPALWLERNVLSFDPAAAVRLEASYPDHRIVFERSGEPADWEQRGYVPGGEWSRDALAAWLADLASFEVSGLAGVGELEKNSQKVHEVIVTLDDGREKTVRAATNHDGDGMIAESSDYPGHVYQLPEWRFRRYFRRLPALFPKAVPHFDVSSVQFMDIRHAGETVKFVRRAGGWSTVASQYAARVGQVERLARLLSAWTPEDYATPDFKSIRPVFAGPMVEIILTDGRVHQYRLAGRHPLFPWRYVILDGASIFSVADATAGVMFPRFADVLDLGRVVPVPAENVREIRVTEDGARAPLADIRRREDGGWESGTTELSGAEQARIVDDMMGWTVAGFYDVDSRPVKPPSMYTLAVTEEDGTEHRIHFLNPDERDIPYLAEGDRAYLLDRKEFFNWLGAVREFGDRAREEEAARILPPAPDEAGVLTPAGDRIVAPTGDSAEWVRAGVQTAEIPLDDMPDAPDSDLIEPETEMSVEGAATDVERFIDRYIGVPEEEVVEEVTF